MRTDQYAGHDYYNMDDLLTEEHKLIREAARAWVKREVSPIIEDAAERCVFPKRQRCSFLRGSKKSVQTVSVGDTER